MCMRHVTYVIYMRHINESCHRCDMDKSHSHICDMDESYTHVMRHVTCVIYIRHV